ncbi:head-tail adaptor [Mycobacterium phage ThetaBob]|uniref:Tail terminator n=2 Tax=Thetabobvirus TaxID=2843467 RepID=A0A385E262_9CAUD|nr:head-tail adaptor [Mycobacterium phage Renaud18]YP_009848830.1 head-tail adaptor [Mycobacterium phage ThetaBob]UCR74387.1 tail terminator [Mycobacterium phage Saroj]UZV39537.1 tail terminator [Mycobacterium phage Ritam007]AXQ64922.1 tail terminator [Mycobacterium phage Renaud18]QDF19898.1 head-to-tail connector complex protein [Mycobacterium phage ThetaBob]
MTSPELLPEAPPNAELVVVAWLTPLGRTALRRKAGDPVPFRLVTRVAGGDDPEIGIDTATVSVHTFASTPEAAVTESDRTHRRMSILTVDPLTEITMLGSGLVVNVDYCRTLMRPTRVDYEDPNVIRYVARYEIGTSYSPI